MTDTRYFQKEMPDQAVYLTSGVPFKFDILATTDDWLIGELEMAAQRGVGGVVKITKEQYDDLAQKKITQQNNGSKSQGNFPRQANTIGMQTLQFSRAPGVGRVVGADASRPTPDPIQATDPKVFRKMVPKVAKVD